MYLHSVGLKLLSYSRKTNTVRILRKVSTFTPFVASEHPRQITKVPANLRTVHKEHRFQASKFLDIFLLPNRSSEAEM